MKTGGMDVKHFKWNDRYYVVQSLQFGSGGPNNDLGAVVLDVTGLPDPTTVHRGGSHPRTRDAGWLPQHLCVQALKWSCAATVYRLRCFCQRV